MPCSCNLTATVRRRLFFVTVLSFALALAYFSAEVFVYHTAELTTSILIPFGVSSMCSCTGPACALSWLMRPAGLTTLWMLVASVSLDFTGGAATPTTTNNKKK